MNSSSETRQSIINSASNLFYKNGYNTTTIKDIVKASNTSQAILNNFFKSKEEICIAYLRHRNLNFSSQIVSFVEQAPKGNQKILAIFSYLELFYKMDDFNGCWNIKVFSEVPIENKLIRSEVLSQKRAFLNYIELLVHDNISAKNTEDCEKLVQQIYLLLESAVAHSNILKEEWPITRAKELTDDLISKAMLVCQSKN
ncbi:TetR/AcrR family transcriptional regulator [uncultured Lacinutrix sp.]|uniref:TetR/AcrR family transcriptional regulator n=1 Tax=uncultured Lacinutrix sp. TaxID=574032 RepID=UPI002632B4C9|nr:TetR/AcrR family transcriptional regulator [uncultured Lacinutrix sp.]